MATLERSAALAGAMRWCELALWRTLSGWASDPGGADPAVAVMWDVHAGHAAWRAGQWWERLPILATVDRDRLVAPPGPGWAALAAALAEQRATVGRMVGAYRVAWPRLLAAYAEVGASTAPVTDGPLRRTLRHAEVDAGSDWHAGTLSLLHLLADGDHLDEAAAVGLALERVATGRPAGEAAQ